MAQTNKAPSDMDQSDKVQPGKLRRREFIKTASAAISIPYIITSTALGNADTPPASDRIVMGGIGIGNMGRGDQGAFLGRERRAVRRRVRCSRKASAKPARARSTNITATPTARPTTTSASCWPAPTSTPCISPRPITGTRSW